MTRNYSKVPDDKRQRLIEMINMNMTIKDAARRVDIKYENAKAIYRVYRKEQRTSKRRNRFRYKFGEDPPVPSTKASTKPKRGAAKKPKFESKIKTRAVKAKKQTLEDDDSELDDDEDENEYGDDESMLDEEEDDQDSVSTPAASVQK